MEGKLSEGKVWGPLLRTLAAFAALRRPPRRRRDAGAFPRHHGPNLVSVARGANDDDARRPRRRRSWRRRKVDDETKLSVRRCFSSGRLAFSSNSARSNCARKTRREGRKRDVCDRGLELSPRAVRDDGTGASQKVRKAGVTNVERYVGRRVESARLQVRQVREFERACAIVHASPKEHFAAYLDAGGDMSRRFLRYRLRLF